MSENTIDESSAKLLDYLIDLCEKIALHKNPDMEKLFKMTSEQAYPKRIATLAEAFGMMVVKLETRQFHVEKVIEELTKAREELTAAKERLARENIRLKRDINKTYGVKSMTTSSRAVKNILNTVEKLSGVSVNVLVTGETGSGKELMAKILHYTSDRNDKNFVAINCSAIPETILEAELFGIEKGVATGVDKRIGKIEMANGGTLFLDEIGDMPMSAQVKILRVLQERELSRVGGDKVIPVDIRVIAATNKDLKKAIEDEKFREDLYYRLKVVSIHLPPLRERDDDVALLGAMFLEIYGKKMGRPGLKFSKESIQLMKTYHWPGNVRELENEVERLVALSYDQIINPDDFSDDIRNHGATPAPDIKNGELDKIMQILKETSGNKSETARRLGLSREGLRKKLNRYMGKKGNY